MTRTANYSQLKINKQLPILMISGKMILLESMAEVLNPWPENLKSWY